VNQSHELMAGLKLSMGTWLLVAEESLRDKVRIVRDHGLPMTVGGSLFEISADRDRLPEYFDLCHRLGITGVEAGHGFTQVTLDPRAVVRMAADRGLTISFEVGAKHDGPFHPAVVDELLELGGSWLEAGATHLVVEARESAVGVGLFDSDGRLNCGLADAFAAAFGLERVVFEAPNKGSQFAFIDHFGPKVALGNIRLEELLRVETYRRGLHSDAYGRGLLGAGDGGARAC
jgi:phosphosulfolactate synthase